MSSDLNVLLTGATGYIGGSVLTTLLASKDPALSRVRITALVRGEERARQLSERGVLRFELFENLDQVELLEDIASRYDIVIHCVSGTHGASSVALIRGLGKRLRDTGRQTYYVHLSGATNVSDLPISGKLPMSHVFSDLEDIHAYERWGESMHPYPQRTNSLAVVKTGLAAGVRTTIITPPTVWGAGTGLFNRLSVQLPVAFAAGLRRGRGVKFGGANPDGSRTIACHLHVEDLARLYEVLLTRLAEGKVVPHGEHGILFAEAGEFAWGDFWERSAAALAKRGRLEPGATELYNLTMKEAAVELADGDEYNVEVAFAANYRIRADVAREWGWRPTKTDEDFLNTFEAEADVILDTLDKNPESSSNYVKQVPKK